MLVEMGKKREGPGRHNNTFQYSMSKVGGLTAKMCFPRPYLVAEVIIRQSQLRVSQDDGSSGHVHSAMAMPSTHVITSVIIAAQSSMPILSTMTFLVQMRKPTMIVATTRQKTTQKMANPDRSS